MFWWRYKLSKIVNFIIFPSLRADNSTLGPRGLACGFLANNQWSFERLNLYGLGMQNVLGSIGTFYIEKKSQN